MILNRLPSKKPFDKAQDYQVDCSSSTRTGGGVDPGTAYPG